MRLTVRVAGVEYIYLVKTPEGKGPIESSCRILYIYIEINLQELGRKDVSWIYSTQVKVVWRNFENGDRT
jgi:hypothetical protein